MTVQISAKLKMRCCMKGFAVLVLGLRNCLGPSELCTCFSVSAFAFAEIIQLSQRNSRQRAYTGEMIQRKRLDHQEVAESTFAEVRMIRSGSACHYRWLLI